LITTLATMQMVKGLTFLVSGGVAVGITSGAFLWLGTSSPLHVQTPVWLCLACFGFFGFLLARTTFGRNTLAVGGNEEAARLAGIAVTRLKIVIFTMQGVVAAFAGVVLAARMGSGQPKSSEGFELEVIAACVLGGVSLTGGVGRMSFVVAGVLIMGVVENAMDLWEVDPMWRYVVRGAVLLAAVLFDRYKQVRAEAVARRPAAAPPPAPGSERQP
jgi:L-arabinose transport system permease protein